MKGYGQFCPVSKAAEILNERWTLLIIRELLCGSRRFNDLRRGVPLMSTSLLSQRLKALQEYGVIERRISDSRRGSEYFLTAAGRELQPIVMSFGEWGQRWVRSQIHEDDLDAGLLMWDMRRTIDAAAFPSSRVAIEFSFSDAPESKRAWWLVVEEGEVELCLDDPGLPIDLYILTDLQTMTQIWMGDMSIAEARQRDLIELQGSRAVIRALPRWLTRSPFAAVPRPGPIESGVTAAAS
jgi:DNA-binding HxlR family transcriptional regulator